MRHIPISYTFSRFRVHEVKVQRSAW